MWQCLSSYCDGVAPPGTRAVGELAKKEASKGWALVGKNARKASA